MLYCPRCRATYKEGTVRFCTNDNTRLVPAPSKEKPAEEDQQQSQGIFTNILGENLLFGEDETLQPKADRARTTRRDRRRRGRKPLFAPSFEPPKGSRFFKSEEGEAKPDDAETAEAEEKTKQPETSFKDVTLAGVLGSTTDTAVEEEVAVEEAVEEEAAETEESKDLVGEIIKNRYAIVEKIGQSEIIAAYVARDKISLNRKVVVTVFGKSKTEEENVQEERFGDAKEILTKIKHPNIETVLDSGETPAGDSFLVSEFLKGKPLSDLLDEGEEFSPKRTAQIVRQVSYGLNELHQKGFIYRNLKPESIILGVSGAGTEQSKLLNPVVSGGEVRGDSLEHRSPEQIEENVVTIASDTYSLGSIAYLLLTGKLPFNAANKKELFKLQKKPTKNALADVKDDLPPGVYDVLKKSLAFDPAERFLQIRHFGDSFQEVLAPPAETKRESTEEQTAEPIAAAPDVNDEITEVTTDATEASEGAEPYQEIPEPKTSAELVEETVDYEEIEDFEEVAETPVIKDLDEPEVSAEAPFDLDLDEPIEEVETEEVETEESDAIEATSITVVPFKSSDEDIIDLDLDEDSASMVSETESAEEEIPIDSVAELKEEVPAVSEDQIIEIDEGQTELVSQMEDDLFELDTDETKDDLFELEADEQETLPPVPLQDSSDVELDLGIPDAPFETESDEFELEIGETKEKDDSTMPLPAAVASVASDLNLDLDDEDELELGDEIETPASAAAEPLELDLESLDEQPTVSETEEPLPVIEFDLDEMEEETRPHKIEKPVEELIPEKEPTKPRIRIITPEKPIYKEEKVEEIPAEIEEEMAKPVVVSTGDVESPEGKEVGKKIASDVEEKNYSWVLLPLLLLLLLIAFFAAFWYYSGQPDNSNLSQNTNISNNGQVALPNQTANGEQTDVNALNANGNLETGEAGINSNSETDFFGEDFGATGGGVSGGSSTDPKLPRSRPPRPRNIKKKPNNVRFKNTRRTTPRKLRNDFLGFTVDYPKDWKKNSTNNNFLDISKNARDGSPIKQFLITKYDSTGTFEGDRAKFRELVEGSNKDLKEILPNYEVISEGETTIQDGRWRVYEVKFKGSGVSGGRSLTVWGRRFWIPIQQPGMDSGFVITMLASSLASDVKGIEDVGGEDGELAEILETFEPTVNN